ncbi:MAG: WG repeat-containing protein [Oscillospiraceae bacterium]
MKKLVTRILPLALCLVLCLSLAPAALAAGEERGVLVYTEIIAPQYEEAGQFSDGLAAVKMNGKWGYINTQGEVVIPFQYEMAFMFSEGKAVVCKQASFDNGDLNRIYDEYSVWAEYGDVFYDVGFIDETGKFTPFTGLSGEPEQLIAGKYDTDELLFHNGYVIFSPLSDERALNHLYQADGKAVCLNSGVSLYGMDDCIPIGSVNEGLVPVLVDGYWVSGWCKVDGSPASDFESARVFLDDNTEVEISWAGTFNQGLAPVWQTTWTYTDGQGEKTELVGFMDSSLQWVIEPQFEGYYYMGVAGTYQVFGTTGLAMVMKDGKYGAIDKTGRTVIPFRYDALWPVREGRIAFRLDGKYGYLDAATLTVAIPAQYESASGFNNGLAVVYDGARAFLIDRDGEPVPGADNLDAATYFTTSVNGDTIVYEPEEYVVIEEKGKFGYGRIEFKPEMPRTGEMSAWAYEEVTAAIGEDLVPAELQNLYLNNITRAEFSQLVVQAVSQVTEKDIQDVVLEQTGRSLASWQGEYPFTDTSDPDVIAAYALGIVTGRGNGIFDPYASITRQEAAALLMRSARVLGVDTSNITVATFVDSSEMGVWATDAVSFVYQINVMNGTGGNAFSPLGTYTREQAYVTIYRLFLAVTNQ